MSAPAALTALAIACAGFTTLALAMDRHRCEMLRHEWPSRFVWPLRLAGGALLAGALHLACLDAGSVSVGILWWLGLLSIAGTALVVLLAYRPRWSLWFGCAALAFGLAQAWF
jgi:hypothetical protein